MKIKNWLINLFVTQKETISEIREYVIFDGDQTNDKTFLALFLPTSLTTKFVWVQVSKTISNNIKKNLHNLEFIKPSSVGKEATDTQIAISIMGALHTIPSIERVYIVSSDGDFIDIVLNISKIFPDKKYILIDNQQHPSSKVAKIAGRTLHIKNPNCSIVKLKKK